MFLRPVRTTQPQVPAQLDLNEPLTRGLLVSLPLAAGTGWQSVGKDRRTGSLTAVTSAVTAQGSGARFAAAGFIDLGTAPILSANQPFALAFYEEMGVLGDYTAFTGLSVGAHRFLWLRGSADLYQCTLGTANGAAAVHFTEVGAPVVGEKIRFLLTGSDISVPSTYRLWANGVEATVKFARTFSATAATTNYIGWDGADTKFNGTIADYNIWGREFSTADAEAYFDNPHRIYTPASRSLWVPGEAGAGGGTTQVTSDLASAYTVQGLVYQDFSASYLIRAASQKDLAAAYAVRGSVLSSLSAAYTIRSAATQDLSAAYLVRGVVQSSLSGLYPVRSATVKDAAAAYPVRGAISADLAASYDIQSAGIVVADLSASYAVRGIAAMDMPGAYSVRGLATADLAGAYPVRGAVQRDLSASYAVAGALSAVWADLTYSYMIEGVAGSGPSAAEIASAVIAAAQATPIWADARAIRGRPLVGTGQPGDEFGV